MIGRRVHLSFLFVGISTACSFGIEPLDCAVIFPKLQGPVIQHAARFRDLRALVSLLTEGAADKQGKLAAMTGLFAPGASPRADTVGELQRRFVQAVVRLKQDDLVGTDPSFQRAVGLLRAWDAEYPAELVQRRVVGLFTLLEDRHLSRVEMDTLNRDIEREHSQYVQELRNRVDEGHGNPARSRLRRDADDGKFMAPVNGTAADTLGGGRERQR